MSGISAQYCDGLELRIKELEAENAALRAELERERMRLAACGAAALGYFEGCSDEYKSASLDDVLRLQVELAALKAGDVVMVPREPTDTMLYMMCRAINTKEERIDSYKEMIAAAPGVATTEDSSAHEALEQWREFCREDSTHNAVGKPTPD